MKPLISKLHSNLELPKNLSNWMSYCIIMFRGNNHGYTMDLGPLLVSPNLDGYSFGYNLQCHVPHCNIQLYKEFTIYECSL